jgi:hypothetical protein
VPSCATYALLRILMPPLWRARKRKETLSR